MITQLQFRPVRAATAPVLRRAAMAAWLMALLAGAVVVLPRSAHAHEPARGAHAAVHADHAGPLGRASHAGFSGAASGRFQGGALVHADWHGDQGARHAGFYRTDWHGGGRWNHGWHGGRFGWWYIDAGVWSPYPYYYPYRYWDPYYSVYPAPYYVLPEAPPSGANLPPQAASWYYCDAARAYYPYVQSCASGWRPVAANPAPAPSAPGAPPPPGP